MILAGYVATLFMGMTLGLLGGGGSILIVPILVYLFHLEPMAATTSSLFIVGFTALAASVPYFKRHEVAFKSGAQFAAASFAGIFISRRFILPRLAPEILVIKNFHLSHSDFILMSFAIMMLLASISMLKPKPPAIQPQAVAGLQTALHGVLIGVATGFVGAGGGFLILPALVNLVGLNMRTAIGTSLVIIAINSLFGFGVSASQNVQIDWTLQLTLLFLAFIGSLIGSRLSIHVSEVRLKKGFGQFILVVGSLIILERMAFH